jgi:ribosomal protein S18 acetylase RimI-like enzyme
VLQVVRASAMDTDALFALQKVAFERIAIRADLPAIPPMAETVAELRQDFATSTILKALWQEDLVGAVRGTLRGNVCHVRRMAVHPEHQGKGIGSALLAKIEHSFSGVAAFELFTHSQNVEALALYKRRG